LLFVGIEAIKLTGDLSIAVTAMTPNGWRYPLVGGTRERYFIGTSFKPRKRLENAQTPASRVHAVLGVFVLRQTRSLKKRHYRHLDERFTQTLTFSKSQKSRLAEKLNN